MAELFLGLETFTPPAPGTTTWGAWRTCLPGPLWSGTRPPQLCWLALRWAHWAQDTPETQHCDIPHNTLGLTCGGRGRADWLVEMLGTNLRHHLPDLSHLAWLPGPEDLEVVPEGRGIRVRIPVERVQEAVARGEEALGKSEEEDMEVEDRQPALILTTRDKYSVLGKHLELVSSEAIINMNFPM